MALALLIAGGLALWFGQLEPRSGERIAAAHPLSGNVEAVLAAVRAMHQSAQATAEFEGQLAARMEARVTACGRNHLPRLLEDAAAIRAAVDNAPCFARKDAELRDWLSLQRVRRLLAQPALTSGLGKTGTDLIANDGVAHVYFPDQANIAVARLRGGRHQALELGSGAALFTWFPDEDESAVSGNGRERATDHGEAIVLVATETGEQLTSFARARTQGFRWLGQQGAIFERIEGNRSVLTHVDFRTSMLTPIADNDPAQGGREVVPLRDGSGRFLLLSAGWVELFATSEGLPFMRLQRQPLDPAIGAPPRRPQFSADGSSLIWSNGDLVFLDIKTLQSRLASFRPARLTKLQPTANADQFLVGLSSHPSERFIYAMTEGTLAQVRLTELPGSTFVFAPGPRRTMVIHGNRITPVDTIPVATPITVDAFRLALKPQEALSPAEVKEVLARREHLSRQALPTAAALERLPGKVKMPNPVVTGATVFRPERQGADGLAEAIDRSLLRRGSSADIERWRSFRNMHGKPALTAKDVLSMLPVYVVRAPLEIPGGLFGANAVVFVVEAGVPRPIGDPGHCLILDLNDGECAGLCDFHFKY